MKFLDNWFERKTRAVADTTSRRHFLARFGSLLVAGSALPVLLPIDRTGKALAAEGAVAGAGDPGDPNSCDYWRHCSIDGFICNCCGGTLTDCPPGTELSPSSWVASCYNPGDGQSYLIAYRDCCGKQVCGRCNCLNTQGELPLYRPEFSNDIVWCFGATDDAMTYHCTISPIVGKAS